MRVVQNDTGVTKFLSFNWFWKDIKYTYTPCFYLIINIPHELGSHRFRSFRFSRSTDLFVPLSPFLTRFSPFHPIRAEKLYFTCSPLCLHPLTPHISRDLVHLSPCHTGVTSGNSWLPYILAFVLSLMFATLLGDPFDGLGEILFYFFARFILFRFISRFVHLVIL